MTEPSYLVNPRLRELDTEIVETGADHGPWVVLADTVFYPEGGGQPDDRGSINGIPVTGVYHGPDGIRHSLEEPLPIGPAHLELDWTRRWDHMQQHSAQHLLTAVAEREFSWPTTAFHLGERVSDIEVEAATIPTENLVTLEDQVNREILASRPISARFVDAAELAAMNVRSRGLPDHVDGPIRIVEIDGLDRNTCGGTHLSSTAEVQVISLLGSEHLRGGTRIFFVAGDRTRRRLRDHERRNLELRSLLGAPDDQLVEVVQTRIDKERALGRDRRRLLEQLADSAADRLASTGDRVMSGHWPEADMPFLNRIARTLTKQPKAAALLTGGADDQGFFVLLLPEARSADGAAILREISPLIDGRGGGKGRLYQGKAGALAGRDKALNSLEELL